MELPEGTRRAIRDAIFGGRTIEAIKLVRETTGCGLKDAKDFVDRFSAELRQQEPGQFKSAQPKKGCLGVLAAVVVVVIVGIVGTAMIGLAMMWSLNWLA